MELIEKVNEQIVIWKELLQLGNKEAEEVLVNLYKMLIDLELEQAKWLKEDINEIVEVSNRR